MALVNCKECEKQISTQAETCPHCGYPMRAEIAQQKEQSLMSEKIAETKKPSTNYQAPNTQYRLRPFGLLAGIILVTIGIYTLFFFIPEHDLYSEKVDDAIGFLRTADKAINQQYYHPDDLKLFTIIGWVVLIVGILQLLTGSVKLTGEATYCKNCDMQVGIKKGFLGRKCERCEKLLDKKTLVYSSLILVSLLLLLTIGSYKPQNDNQPTSRGNSFQNTGSTNQKKPEQPKVVWVDYAKPVIEDFIRINEQIIADAIQSITHPTGKNAKMVTTKVSHYQNTFSVKFVVEWRGGFIGKAYKTTVTWEFGKDQYIGATVTSDTAVVAIEEENKDQLNDYFDEKVYRVLKDSLK